MKKTLFAIASVSVLLFTSCTKQEQAADNDLITARIENLSTRTALDQQGDVYNVNWVEGDQISVSNGTQKAIYKALSGGSSVTDFSKITWGSFTGTEFTAYYPTDLADGVLPSIQKYVEGNVSGLPMYAEGITDLKDIVFKPVTGVIRLNVSTSVSDVQVSSITLSSDQGFSGACNINSGIATVSADHAGDVTLDCAPGVAIGATAVPFYISVPANAYTGMTIAINTADGKHSVAKLEDKGTYSVRRGELRTISVNISEFTDNLPASNKGEALLMMGTDFNEVLKQFVKSTAKSIDNDNTIKKIVFKTNDPTVGEKKVSYFNSKVPIYASWNASTATVTVTTAAPEIMTNESLSFAFCYMHALETIEGLTCFNTSRTKFFDRMFIMAGRFSPKLKEIDCSSFNTENGISFQSMFDSCLNATKIDVSSFNTSNGESFNSMFNACNKVQKLDVSHFNTAKANRMSYMVNCCKAVEALDVSNFNTSNVTTMAFMFTHCEKVKTLDVSKFDTRKVTSMDNMFSDCWVLSELDLKNFNTDKVTDTRSMFNRCKSIKTLDMSHMSFPATTRMTYMFYQMEKLETLHIEGMDMTRWDASANQIHMFRYEPCLKDLYLGAKGYNSPSFLPTSFFTDSADGVGKRTGSYSGAITIHCCKDAVSWLPKTTLRWIASGYSGQSKIPVKFVDYITGEEYTPTWAAN